jgi:hypothetical protein
MMKLPIYGKKNSCSKPPTRLLFHGGKLNLIFGQIYMAHSALWDLRSFTLSKVVNLELAAADISATKQQTKELRKTVPSNSTVLDREKSQSNK